MTWRLPRKPRSTAPSRGSTRISSIDEATGEYRIYNDRWYRRNEKGEGSCGIWIVRDGLSREVHRSDRGTRLRSGDEIHLGKAVLRFAVK